MYKLRLVAGLLLVAGSLAGTAYAAEYDNGFEEDAYCWFGASRVASGGGSLGVVSAEGSWHAEADPGAYTRLGGYGDGETCDSVATVLTFPEGGYTTSLDVYLDVDGQYANNSLLDLTSAINNQTGSHLRDFIFNCGFFNDDQSGNGLGTGPRYICSASNNAPGWPANPAREPTVITSTSGWFTFTHVFADDGNGALSVNLSVSDASGSVIKTWTLTNPADLIDSVVGANRYTWFATNQIGTIAIDNSYRSTPDSGEVAAVPTLGQYALMIMAALMLLLGLRSYRRSV